MPPRRLATRATPNPYRRRPSMAALTRSGARKASEIVLLIFRTLQPSRPALPAPRNKAHRRDYKASLPLARRTRRFGGLQLADLTACAPKEHALALLIAGLARTQGQPCVMEGVMLRIASLGLAYSTFMILLSSSAVPQVPQVHIAQRPPGLYTERPLIRTAGLAPVPFIASITNTGAFCSVARRDSRCVGLASSGPWVRHHQ